MNTTGTFTGWYRQTARNRWRPVVHAQSEDEAWAMLLDHVAGGDKLILAAGELDPNDKPSTLTPPGSAPTGRGRA
jgi:hypothetical protein